MSNQSDQRYIDLLMTGEALLEEIDDFVDLWHEVCPGEKIHQFLGMTKSEYGLWVQEPDMLPFIVKARRERAELLDFVNDNYDELRLAARASNASQASGLARWLRAQGHLD